VGQRVGLVGVSRHRVVVDGAVERRQAVGCPLDDVVGPTGGVEVTTSAALEDKGGVVPAEARADVEGAADVTPLEAVQPLRDQVRSRAPTLHWADSSAGHARA
jgi:hypothetical protein